MQISKSLVKAKMEPIIPPTIEQVKRLNKAGVLVDETECSACQLNRRCKTRYNPICIDGVCIAEEMWR